MERRLLFFLIEGISIPVLPNTPKAKDENGMPIKDMVIFDILEKGPGFMPIVRHEVLNFYLVGLVPFMEKGGLKVLSHGAVEEDMRDILYVEVTESETWRDRNAPLGEKERDRKPVVLR